jgi:hypothetical protein
MIIRKVKKTQHPNLKFARTWGEIPKTFAKKCMNIKGER